MALAVVADARQFELSHDLVVTAPRVMPIEVYIPPIAFIVHLRRRVAALSTVFRASALKIVPVLSLPLPETEPRERVRVHSSHCASIQENR